jgi:uncharacterized membrane protein
MRPLPQVTRQAIKSLVVAALFGYPIAVYIADGYLTPSQLLAGLLLLLAARVLVVAWIRPEKLTRDATLAGLLAAAAVGVLWLLPDVELAWLRLYPTLFALAVFAMFFGSLFTEKPLVERIARLVHADLPPQAVAHCRRMTWVWSGVLFINTLVSLYTSFGTSFRVWSLYNGLIVYCIFGTLIVGEYLLRLRLRRKWDAT